MKVLSLFDGMSCGMLALKRAGIHVERYDASEVDNRAISVSKRNWPEINNVGSVIDFIEKYGATSWEVDALPPNVLNSLLEDSIRAYIDTDMFDEVVSREQQDKDKLYSLFKYL